MTDKDEKERLVLGPGGTSVTSVTVTNSNISGIVSGKITGGLVLGNSFSKGIIAEQVDTSSSPVIVQNGVVCIKKNVSSIKISNNIVTSGESDSDSD